MGTRASGVRFLRVPVGVFRAVRAPPFLEDDAEEEAIASTGAGSRSEGDIDIEESEEESKEAISGVIGIVYKPVRSGSSISWLCLFEVVRESTETVDKPANNGISASDESKSGSTSSATMGLVKKSLDPAKPNAGVASKVSIGVSNGEFVALVLSRPNSNGDVRYSSHAEDVKSFAPPSSNT